MRRGSAWVTVAVALASVAVACSKDSDVTSRTDHGSMIVTVGDDAVVAAMAVDETGWIVRSDAPGELMMTQVDPFGEASDVGEVRGSRVVVGTNGSKAFVVTSVCDEGGVDCGANHLALWVFGDSGVEVDGVEIDRSRPGRDPIAATILGTADGDLWLATDNGVLRVSETGKVVEKAPRNGRLHCVVRDRLYATSRSQADPDPVVPPGGDPDPEATTTTGPDTTTGAPQTTTTGVGTTTTTAPATTTTTEGTTADTETDADADAETDGNAEIDAGTGTGELTDYTLSQLVEGRWRPVEGHTIPVSSSEDLTCTPKGIERFDDDRDGAIPNGFWTPDRGLNAVLAPDDLPVGLLGPPLKTPNGELYLHRDHGRVLVRSPGTAAFVERPEGRGAETTDGPQASIYDASRRLEIWCGASLGDDDGPTTCELASR